MQDNPLSMRKYPGYHLCHLNIGNARAPLTDSIMEGFVAKLDEINNLAYSSPGFVWHLKIDINNPDDLALYGEPGVLFNLSVWDSTEALYGYVYKTHHVEMMKLRKQWFGEMGLTMFYGGFMQDSYQHWRKVKGA